MKLFKVFDKDGKLLGHVNAADEKAGLEQAKKRNKLAHKCGTFTGGAMPVVPAKPPVVVGADAEKAKAEAEAAEKEKAEAEELSKMEAEEAEAKAKAEKDKK